jgi:2-dehydropantoate 2-reductase
MLERKRGLGVADGHPLSKQLVALLNDAGLNAHLYPDAASMKWSKMLTNLLANATSAILDMSPAEIFSQSELCRLEVEQLREAIRVMAIQGIQPIGLPGTPVRALAFAVRWLPLALIQPILIRAVGGGRGGKMPSFHIDLHSRRGQTEVNHLNGAVVRFGERSNIPTPVNRLLNEILQDLTIGKQKEDTFNHKPEELVRRLRMK